MKLYIVNRLHSSLKKELEKISKNKSADQKQIATLARGILGVEAYCAAIEHALVQIAEMLPLKK